MTAKSAMPAGATAGTPQVLLAQHLKQLKLPTLLREYEKVARACARDGVDHARYLLRLVELELLDRERRVTERRIREPCFPAVKSLDTFAFTATPSLSKMPVLDLAVRVPPAARERDRARQTAAPARRMWRSRSGLAACQKGFSTLFITAHALAHQLMAARDEKRLLRLQA